jgi:hypothetical protein
MLKKGILKKTHQNKIEAIEVKTFFWYFHSLALFELAHMKQLDSANFAANHWNLIHTSD